MAKGVVYVVFSSRHVLLRLVAVVTFFLFCWPANSGAQSRRPTQTFPLERDHLFVWVAPGAPEAEKLSELGLFTDGKIHKHAGQGTASKVFLFENAYLELIWVDEPDVARGKAKDMNTNLVERANWRSTGASPFGIGLHYQNEGDLAPFPAKKYWAEWMKPNTSIDIAESAVNVKEPFYFIVPEYLKVPSLEKLKQALESQPELRKVFTHALGVHRLTGITVVQDTRRLSQTALLLAKNRLVFLKQGKATYAELTFDSRAQGKTLDARPTLPLVLKY